MGASQAAHPGDQWQALIICPDRGMAAQLIDLLGHEAPLTRVIDWNEYPTTADLSNLMKTVALNVCFLDMESDLQRASELLASGPELPGNLPLIALLSSNDPDLILRCLRQGACGFLLRPFTADQLASAFQRVANLFPIRPETAGPEGKVSCVVPAKGASGATTVAVNLAYHLQRLGAKKVLLADLDPLTSPLAFLLKLKSSYSFVDALLNSGRLDDDLWKGLVIPHQGVDVLLSPESPADGVIENHDATEVVEFARRNYDVIVLDTGAAYGRWTASLARHSDEVLLVTTNELPALYGAQRVIAHLERNGVDRGKLRLVLNRYRRNIGTDLEDVAKALGIEVFHLIPVDKSALDGAMMSGRPASADSQFGKSLATLASRLSGREPTEEKGSLLKGLFSLFSRT